MANRPEDLLVGAGEAGLKEDSLRMLSARQLLVKPEHGSAQSSAPLSHKLFRSASLDV